MSTPDWKRTASLGTAAAAAMRDALARHRSRREPDPLAPRTVEDAAQTAALLALDARLARLEGAALGYRNLLQAGGGGGAHPFKVIDASDANGPKVRVMPGSFNGWESTVGGADNSSPKVWYPVGGRTEASPPIPTLSVSPSTPWIALYFESNIASGNVYSPWFTLHDVRALAASSEFLSGYESGTKRAHPIAYLQFDEAGKIMSIRQQVFRNLAGDCTQWQNNSHAYVRFWS